MTYDITYHTCQQKRHLPTKAACNSIMPRQPPAKRARLSTRAISSVSEQPEVGRSRSVNESPTKLDKGKGKREATITQAQEQQGKQSEEEADTTEELEAWQDFAADHYETVEQLPLELHRNFRLLRELDDGTLAQMDTLKKLIRAYVSGRIALERPRSLSTPLEEAALKKNNREEDKKSNREEDSVDVEMAEETLPHHESPQEGEERVNPTSEATAEPTNSAEPSLNPSLTDEKQREPGVPLADGADGLIISCLPESQANVPPRAKFPTLPSSPTAQHNGVVGNDDPNINSVAQAAASQYRSSSIPLRASRPAGPHSLLPEISRLVREIVRTSDEKVAVAIGAYNAVDRHIRALDSALTAQEASILLGLRPSTLPSNAIDEALDVEGGTGKVGIGQLVDERSRGQGTGDVVGEGEEGEVTLGMGGGGSRKKGKKRKGKPKQRESQGGNEEGKAEENWNIPPDPNEPRYCYCNRVSFGEMIGCDNDECPLEWFHLQCIGLENPPTGKWLCDLCKPKANGHGAGASAGAARKGRVSGGRKR
ncbi:PHD-finger protein [Cryptococcus neoformans C23]|uniref:Chromatin modification-related protein n=1 Tax=Cryptococcus neoformans (strain H99 / ATCC 208821 / CBS 10515 / FGSC 9487) TaxID=235443 RepID=J9VXW7_CRYN9|nr:PHD-finger protein [Cryptococcus neoformans var. grubii H99]AUB26483.1 PHD-finger protein [Cryptococcus neoformans var. grubii]OWZ29644.1 PHD-finger protein [Cryptococcus neoformans var. grubii AD2-60a]OWZ37594.1 PHD-finger protein [Cryptococcus neoformans var. grubii AD1-83a]OWZ41515.1 PHD-finger protein [Cryptococcus neoformans var. grubii C23]OXG55281.1 PHD-finger protein [Cryptococcus neoformans var. grubii MW-RSA1955]OXG58517.1 PHD-finger protein [Cryptococcus neoformans var. grubii C|eukprot:XP_012050918.1 PHD-finger protein [Cryptococcus neoformans var. grubii H99]